MFIIIIISIIIITIIIIIIIIIVILFLLLNFYYYYCGGIFVRIRDTDIVFIYCFRSVDYKAISCQCLLTVECARHWQTVGQLVQDINILSEMIRFNLFKRERESCFN